MFLLKGIAQDIPTTAGTKISEPVTYRRTVTPHLMVRLTLAGVARFLFNNTVAQLSMLPASNRVLRKHISMLFK